MQRAARLTRALSIRKWRTAIFPCRADGNDARRLPCRSVHGPRDRRASLARSRARVAATARRWTRKRHRLRRSCIVASGKLVTRVDGKLVTHAAAQNMAPFHLPSAGQGRRAVVHQRFLPHQVASGEYDVLAIQLVTVGDKARPKMAEALRKPRTQISGLPLSARFRRGKCAEALAEMWHKRIRHRAWILQPMTTPTRPQNLPAEIPRQPLQLRLPGMSEP